ncbi:PHB depolymerase family esterase [Gemmata sp. JC717]|uniref:carboxylesterase family protein n=1 Tax=Gemmata algarum TaxID=2975278 RepID=UPI0021BB0CFE|nr:PHB depolymerase family esterase [Gemmata algarum]MDY3552859.1 PHB depolymerase family esterase [Gemmata algarum]
MRFVLSAVLLVGACGLGSAADVVILKDGFIIQGTVRKESEPVFDKASGTTVRIVKANGLDMIDEGPKVTIFSTHAKQLGEISPDIKIRPDYKAYTTQFPGRKSDQPISSIAAIVKTGEFNAKWVRTINVKETTGGANVVDHQITYMDPYYIYIVSATHRWRGTYRTTEWDPKTVRKLLSTHPELAEPDGKCDPLKRVAIGKFMLDAGWLQSAKDEMDRLRKDFTGEMNKEAKAAHEKLLKEIDQAVAELVVREAELALAAGRYKYTAEVLAVFPEKNAEPKQVARAAKVGADLKTGQERYTAARRLLGALIETVSGARGAVPFVAAGGGGAMAAWAPPKEVSAESLALVDAARYVFAELHPDSALRIETFVTLAAQAERERAANKEPTKTPNELLATAISGWVTGRNGANPNTEIALKIWAARDLILAHQRGDTVAGRNELLKQFKKNMVLEPQQLAQIISLLPPVDPEDLANRSGKAVELGKGGPTGVYRRKSAPVSGYPTGIDYLVKLPPEYHHGRAYPIIIALTAPGIDAEQVLAPLMTEADKNGYIVIAPEWVSHFEKTGWQWRGEDHVLVTATLRDAVRHFTVDNDRVFMLGVGDGGNMAMDIGTSHPDLFAGVIPIAPIPKWQGQFIESWRNAQKLPFYVVTGEMAGQSVTAMRNIFEPWTRHGFPAVMSVYKGRAVEWYSAEAPVMFDWMSRKKRINGAATLALGTYRQPWVMLRESDSRFYWLQADKANPGQSGGAVVAATIQGDIRGNNLLDLKTFRVQRLSVWLGADMIDWAKPVRVQLNGRTPEGWNKPKAIEPDVEVLLEDYFQRGDRRMLFLNKIELTGTP